MVNAQAAGRAARDIFFDIVSFPFWWYSFGLSRTFSWAGEAFQSSVQMAGVGVWIRNIFVPMYGQYDWQSRLISVFMRVVQIIFRTIGLFFASVGIAVAVVVYVTLPFVLFGAFLFEFFGELPF